MHCRKLQFRGTKLFFVFNLTPEIEFLGISPPKSKVAGPYGHNTDIIVGDVADFAKAVFQ